MSNLHFCTMCGAQRAEVIQMSVSPKTDGDGVEGKVRFLCGRCGKTTSTTLDGIIIKHLSEMVDSVVQQMIEERK